MIAGEVPAVRHPTASNSTPARTLIAVPADEVVPGDQVRDHGVLRRVASTGVSVVEWSVVLFFDDRDGVDDQLRVPLLQFVSVWRVCRD